MKKSGQKSIDNFYTCITQLDWPSIIKQAQKLYLRVYYIQKVRANIKKKTKAKVNTILNNRKKKLLRSIEE